MADDFARGLAAAGVADAVDLKCDLAAGVNLLAVQDFGLCTIRFPGASLARRL